MKTDGFAWTVFCAGLGAGALLATAATTIAQTSLPETLRNELRTLTQVMSKIRSDYVEPVDDAKLVAKCIEGMVGSLDERSEYYDAEGFRRLRATGDENAAVGLEFTIDGGLPKVVAPIDGSPAARAGLAAGDIMAQIDGSLLYGRALTGVRELLRGRTGSEVRLTVLKRGELPPVEMALKREPIKAAGAHASALEGGIAYVRVPALTDATASGIRGELDKLAQDRNMNAVILDLRNNSGGLLSSAVDVAGLFLPADTLVGSTAGRSQESKARFTAGPKTRISALGETLRAMPSPGSGVPVAVLVNRGTASGAEIVAGTLQDHKRALIVGEKTSGTGSIQTIYPVDRSGLRLTTAYWHKPKGDPLRGISPDVAVDDLPGRAAGPDPAKDPALAAALSRLGAEARKSR